MMIRNPTDKAIPCPICGDDDSIFNCELCNGMREILIEDDDGWTVFVVEPDNADDEIVEDGARDR